jgi:hypothetical protein
MAADDTLIVFTPASATLPSSAFATFDVTAAGHLVLDFDDTANESVFFVGVMPGQYDGTSDIEVVLGWKLTTFGAGSQTVEWEVSWYRIADDADSNDSYTFAASQVPSGNPVAQASATGELSYDVVTFTNAQADGIQPNEHFVLKVARDAAQGTASPGDAELAFVEVRLA